MRLRACAFRLLRFDLKEAAKRRWRFDLTSSFFIEAGFFWGVFFVVILFIHQIYLVSCARHNLSSSVTQQL